MVSIYAYTYPSKAVDLFIQGARLRIFGVGTELVRTGASSRAMYNNYWAFLATREEGVGFQAKEGTGAGVC